MVSSIYQLLDREHKFAICMLKSITVERVSKRQFSRNFTDRAVQTVQTNDILETTKNH